MHWSLGQLRLAALGDGYPFSSETVVSGQQNVIPLTYLSLLWLGHILKEKWSLASLNVFAV